MIHHNERFMELSEKLGGMNQEHLQSFFYWNNPFALKHWTMNAVELLMIGGAVFGLLHAIQWYRQKNDPGNICVWFATVIYILIIEPPLYFPEIFGLDTFFQVVFIHNEFTTGIIFNRTPLYIIALYPATIYTSYALVQHLNIFEKPNGLWLGAIAVGFTNHCFYEIFDHFGPQYGWWLWDYDVPAGSLTMGSVPLASVVGFSFVGATAAAYLSKRYIVNYIERGEWNWQALAWRTFTVGALTPGLLALWSPHLVYSMFISSANPGLITAIHYLQLFALVAIALYAFSKSDIASSGNIQHNFTRTYPIIYLLSFAALWIYALPEYIASVDGLTGRGTPIGSLPYAVLCFIGCVFILKKALPGNKVAAHSNYTAEASQT